MAQVSTGDCGIFYTDDGAGDGLVLVHGWGCDSHDWNVQIADFVSRGFRVVAPDLRGHGRSGLASSGRYGPHDCADDLAALLDRERLGPVVAIGHSFGTFVVSVLAIERPELVRAVVAVDPGYGRDDHLVEIADDLIKAMAGGDTRAAAAAFEQMDAASTPPGLRTWHQRRVLGMPSDVLVESLRALYRDRTEFASRRGADRYLPRRRCPVLSIHTVEAQAAWEAALLDHPLSRAELWSGTGHWLHQERPEEFDDLVVDWIASLESINGHVENL